MKKQIVKIGTVNVYQSDNGTVVDALKSKLQETEQELEKVKEKLHKAMLDLEKEIPRHHKNGSNYELTPKIKQALDEYKNGEYTTMTLDEMMDLGKEHEYIPLDDSEKVCELFKMISEKFNFEFHLKDKLFSDNKDFDFKAKDSRFNGAYSKDKYKNGEVLFYIGNINTENYYFFNKEFKIKLIEKESETILEITNELVTIYLNIDKFLKLEHG